MRPVMLNSHRTPEEMSELLLVVPSRASTAAACDACKMNAELAGVRLGTIDGLDWQLGASLGATSKTLQVGHRCGVQSATGLGKKHGGHTFIEQGSVLLLQHTHRWKPTAAIVRISAISVHVGVMACTHKLDFRF